MKGKIKNSFNTSLALSILFVIIGLFLFIKPDATISIISCLVGVFLILIGIINIYKYFVSESKINVFSFSLSYGVLLVIAGLFVIIDTSIFASLFNVILGVWIVFNSVTKFQYGLVLKKAKNKDYTYTFLVSFLMFLWGITLFINPFKNALSITQIIGVFIIIYAVLDIMDNFIIRKNIDDIINEFDNSLIKK